MPRVVSRQKRATLTDQALKEIREAIRSGKLKPGERLVEMQLAEDMEELYSLRSALEELAVRILLENLDDKKIKELETIIQSMQQASQTGNLNQMISEDLRFHQAICELSGHRKLLEVWQTLESQLQVFLTIEKDFFETAYLYVSTHDPIMDAIKQRIVKKAEKAIRDHLGLAMRVIREGYWDKSS